MTAPALWDALSRHLDEGAARPRLAPWVECATHETRSGKSLVVANHREGTYLRFDGEEADVVERLDGSRTVRELCVEGVDRGGAFDVGPVVDVVRSLRDAQCLEDASQNVDLALRRALTPRGAGPALRRAAATLTIEWRDAHRLARYLYDRGVRRAYSRPAFVVGAAVGAGGLLAFLAVQGRHFDVGARSTLVALVMLVLLNAVLVFIHELGHATYLVHHGRRVRGAGFRIYLGSPAFFVDSSDALMLDRPTRIRQSLAGPYFESVVTGACAIVLWATGSSPIASVLYTFVSLNYFILLLNLVPFLELDGYWVLADLLRFRDLRRRAMALVRKDAWIALRDRHRLSRTETALAIYGVLGVVFTVFALGLAIWFWHDTFGPFVDQLWNEGVFGRVAFVALLLVVAAPLVQAVAAAVAGIGRAILQIGRRLHFRAQRAWRFRAAQLLDDSPLFDDLAEDVRRDIAGRVERIGAAAGTTIVHQGEAADAMYAVGGGELDVVEQDGDRERVLARLGPGDTFGELGLASGSPRAATVRARTRVELFAIDKATFDRLLADRVRLPSLAATAQQLADLQALPPYAHLSARELRDLYEHGRWLHVAPGQVLVREGDEPGGFYVIRSGRMAVVRGDREVGELGPGAGFGELALLHDAPRAATVVAKTPAQVFEVSRQGFDRVVAAAFDRPSRTSHVTSFQRA